MAETNKVKIERILKKHLKNISSILSKTNWKVEAINSVYAGAVTTISLGGDKRYFIDLTWMSKRRFSGESFTTSVDPSVNLDLLAGNEVGSETNYYKELGYLMADNALLTSIREQLVSFFNEVNIVKEEISKNKKRR